MILVAESGSTKTEWRLLRGKDSYCFSTEGINPFHSSKEYIKKLILNSGLMEYASEIKEIHYFGAGLANDSSKKLIDDILTALFDKVEKTEVDDDLIAAATAIFGRKKGIACILGTGSNTGLIENGRKIEKIPPLGYILGDEGSGAHLGIQFINSFLKRDFSEELHDKLSSETSLDMNMILEKVYREKQPGRFLASYTRLLKEYEAEPEIDRLIKNCFQLFTDKNLKKYTHYKELDIGFAGSVAWFFRPQLESVLKANEIRPVKIVQNPIEELVKFYRNPQ